MSYKIWTLQYLEVNILTCISFFSPATPEQIAKAKDVVKKLTFKFSSENFDNPVLQNHWRNIEALALERDEPDKFEDLTCKCFQKCFSHLSCSENGLFQVLFHSFNCMKTGSK